MRVLPGVEGPDSYTAIRVVLADPQCGSGGRCGVLLSVVGRTEKPLARAGAHLSAGRLAEAEGVFRAVLNIDPEEFRAYLGLADCATGNGRVEHAVELLSEGSAHYAEAGSMRSAFALMTKALAIAPSRLDLHIDVAQLEAADGRAEMAVLRLENLARTYLAAGQEEEAELVLEAAAAFGATPVVAEPSAPPSPAVVNPPTAHASPPPAPRVAATPPPPPPTSRVTTIAEPSHPTPTPIHAMVRPSPLVANAATPPPVPLRRAPPVAARKAKRARRGVSKRLAPKWCPSTVVNPPPPRKKKAKPAPAAALEPVSALKRAIAPAPRPRKQPKGTVVVAKKRASISPAPSPKRGGKKLDRLPPLRLAAKRLRGVSAPVRRGPSEEDRTAMWRRPTPTPA